MKRKQPAKAKRFTLFCDVYKCWIRVIIGGTVGDATKHVKSIWPDCDYDPHNVIPEGRCYFNDDQANAICWFDVWPRPGCLTHEAMHLAANILRKRDVGITDDSEECHTYLAEWIVEQIDKRCRKK